MQNRHTVAPALPTAPDSAILKLAQRDKLRAKTTSARRWRARGRITDDNPGRDLRAIFNRPAVTDQIDHAEVVHRSGMIQVCGTEEKPACCSSVFDDQLPVAN
jgi:hypothetical protein